MMNYIWDTFSNREIAVIIWFLIFLVWALSKHTIRESFIALLKIFSIKIILSILLMLIYISLMVVVFFKIGFWDATNIKDTIIWSVATAFVMLVNINKARGDKYYFKNTILDNIKLVVVIEYIINLYVFNLITELILTPVLVLLSIMLAIAESDSKYKYVKILLYGILSIIFIGFIIFSLYNIFVDLNSFATKNNLRAFLLPPIFTIIFLPFIYLMALYASYEILFIRMGSFIKDSELFKFAKREIIFAFHFNLKALNEWSKQSKLFQINDKNDVLNAINEFKGK